MGGKKVESHQENAMNNGAARNQVQWEKSTAVWCHDYVKASLKGGWYKRMVRFGIHIHLLPAWACVPLQVMAVYNIKEEEK